MEREKKRREEEDDREVEGSTKVIALEQQHHLKMF